MSEEGRTMWDRSAAYTRIKLCEFEWLDPAYAACALGADALGFHIFKHQDAATKARRFAEIFELLPRGVEKVLLSDLDFEPLCTVLKALPADGLQLYPDWEPERLDRLREAIDRPIKILKVMSAISSENVVADPEGFLRRYETTADAILLDSARRGGTGQTADWAHCARVVAASKLPVFLAGGLDAANVGEAIARVRPFGVDVETGVSDRIPGGPLVKNLFKCRAFVDAVLRADRELAKMKRSTPR